MHEFLKKRNFEILHFQNIFKNSENWVKVLYDLNFDSIRVGPGGGFSAMTGEMNFSNSSDVESCCLRNGTPF